MTSTPAIAPAPPASESAPSPAASGLNQDFASALSGAAAKPAPKSPPGKTKAAAPAGVPLPIGGMVSPPLLPTAPIVAPEAASAPVKAAPTAAVAAAVLPRIDVDTAAAPAAAAASPKAAPAVMDPSPILNGATLDSDAEAPAAPISVGSDAPAGPIITALPVTPVPAGAQSAAAKSIASRTAALNNASAGAVRGTANDADAGDGTVSAGEPAATPTTPATPTTDLAEGSAADAARAAAALVTGAPDATPSAGPGSNPTVNAVTGLTAATANAQQDAAAATLTATAVKAATMVANINVQSAASAEDKHGRQSDASVTAGTSGGIADPTQIGGNSSSTPDTTPAATMNVSPHVETPEFGQGVAERVSWMLDNNISSAKLQVNPPQLGPIEVRIALQGGHAQVWMTSHSAVTRDALESSSPKLREALGAQGFGQVSVDISQRSFQDRPSQSQPYEWTPSAERSGTTASIAAAPTSLRSSSGLLDAYA